MEAKFVTDINQSRELSEFLALESADFGWDIFSDGSTRLLPIDDWDLVKDGWGNVEFIPAWSLSALFNASAKSFALYMASTGDNFS